MGETGVGRSQYTDWWIEPNWNLSREVRAYVGYGTVHDINQADGRGDSPVMVGIKILI